MDLTIYQAEAARQSLVDDFGWQIEDAGKICLNDQDCDGLFDADECDGGTGTSSVLRVDDFDCDGVSVEIDCNDDDPSVGPAETLQNCDGSCVVGAGDDGNGVCVTLPCGNGVLDEGEACDDAGASATCNALCQFTDNFVSVWRIAAEDLTLTLPLRERDSTGALMNYAFTVDWGDGISTDVTHFDDPNAQHTYGAPGDYEVVIAGVMNLWDGQSG